MLSAKQGNHWYHCFNFIGWVKSILGNTMQLKQVS